MHVYSDASPGPGFEPAEPDLEDVYFSTMAGHIGRRSEQRAAGGGVMKLWEIFRFEFAYQLRRPWPWLSMAVLVVFAFVSHESGHPPRHASAGLHPQLAVHHHGRLGVQLPDLAAGRPGGSR